MRRPVPQCANLVASACLRIKKECVCRTTQTRCGSYRQRTSFALRPHVVSFPKSREQLASPVQYLVWATLTFHKPIHKLKALELIILEIFVQCQFLATAIWTQFHIGFVTIVRGLHIPARCHVVRTAARIQINPMLASILQSFQQVAHVYEHGDYLKICLYLISDTVHLTHPHSAHLTCVRLKRKVWFGIPRENKRHKNLLTFQSHQK